MIHYRSGIISLALLSIGSMLSTTTNSAEFAGYLTLTTDYAYRGITRSDGHGAIQLGGDVSLDSGLYFGAWGSTIDIDDGATRQRDLEIDYYAGYGHELTENWSVAAALVAFTFPGAIGEIHYNYEEVSISLNYDDRVWVEYAHAPDFYNSGAGTHSYELFVERPLAAGFNLSAGIGHYDVSAFSGRSYSFWQLAVSKPVGRLDLDLRYHDASRWVPRVSNPERAEPRLVLSARLQF